MPVVSTSGWISGAAVAENQDASSASSLKGGQLLHEDRHLRTLVD